MGASVLLLFCRQLCASPLVRLLLQLLLTLLTLLSCERARARIGPVLDSTTHCALPLGLHLDAESSGATIDPVIERLFFDFLAS
jgi:hypothetical protein